jgi:galactokinase
LRIMIDPKTVLSHHRSKFPHTGSLRLFSCPGRINLIGEHVDYNGGHVLPAAIDRRIYLCISPNEVNRFRLSSQDFDEYTEIPIDGINTHPHESENWWLYPFGAIVLLSRKWTRGYDMTFLSDIPIGAGMSSSAAIIVVTLFAFTQLENIAMTSDEMALLAQRVEREIVGVRCGIMDQFVIIHGKKNHAIILDTRDLRYHYVKHDAETSRFVLINSGISHRLKDSEYNIRRKECESALSILQNNGAPITYLCDLDSEQFHRLKNHLSPIEKKRVHHVINENQRTLNFRKELERNNLRGAGKMLYASHKSLKELYEVSIPEIDEMVGWTKSLKGVYGSRMMGGGFGGCTINMVRTTSVTHFKEKMTEKFNKRFSRTPAIYECTIENGVDELLTEKLSNIRSN